MKLRKPRSVHQPRKKRLRGVGPIAAGNVAGMPEKWWRRWLWYANPKRFKDFWFTKEGGKAALRILVGIGGTLLAIMIGLFLYFAKDLPSPGQINSKALEQTTTFYDRTGETVLYEVHGDKNRTVVQLDQMSPYIKNATVAIEDKDFYKHGAFSSVGIIRAAINNVLNRGDNDTLQGGSTITQQYVKNALLSNEQVITRKIKELILSIQIEQLYNKDDILELYLNEIPYGAQAYGVQAAAKTYFNKDAKDLTLDEAALLAALPQAPTYYSPYGDHVDALMARKNRILTLMADQGYISQEEAEQAQEVDVYAKVNAVPNLYANITAPHFVLAAEQELEEKYGSAEVQSGGLKVITTLDLDKQKKAEESVAAGIPVVERNGGNNAALVAGDPNNGEVLAMVGSRGFSYPGFGAFNAATALRQPGSSFKPYVYAAGFQTGKWGPGSVMYDVRTDFGGGYVPNNYDNRFHGQMTIRKALASSFNIPAVKMLYIVGVQETIDLAHKMGITTLEDPANYGLSLVLGAGEVRLVDHVNGFETFANGGQHYASTYIKKVTDQKGKVLEEHNNPQAKRVFDPQVAYAITSILKDPVARSTTFRSSERYFNVPNHEVASKTGTTDKARDGWMMQYSRNLVAGVWVGHSDNKAMGGITSDLTGPIVNGFMRSALENEPASKLEQPAGMKSVTLDSFTGKLPGEGTKQTHNDIFPSNYTAPAAATTQKATIDKVSQKLATDCTPPLARQEVSGQGLTAEIPPTDPAYGRWNSGVQGLANSLGLGGGGAIPTEKDNVHNCGDAKPTVALSATQPPGQNYIKVTATVTGGTHPLDIIRIQANGQPIVDQNIGGNGVVEVNYTPPGPGTYQFTAQVIDKALYEGTNSTSGTLAFGGSGSNILGLISTPLSGWYVLRPRLI